MKICKLTLIALVPAFGFVAAMPTPYHIPPQNSGHSLLDNYLSKQKEAPAGQSAVKSENDKFLERWATDFGAPAPAVAPSTNPGTFTKALTSAADALFGLLGKGKADKGKNPQPIHNVDDADKPTSSRAAEKAPEKQHTINPENKIVNWRADPPHKYTPSFDSDDEEEAGPSGFAPSWAEQYMPDGKPDEVIPSSYQDNFIASSEIEASGVTAEELAEELWGKAIVGSIPVQSHEEYWYLPKKRSGWARFLEWCRDAWEKVVGVFKKKKKDA